MNKLIIADDEGKTTVVPLVRDEITIGRKEGNTIRLTERNVSRRHARLLRSNGLFVVEDLESYNGVLVNGEVISTPRSVQDGDRITIGDYQLSLRSERAAAGPKVGPQESVEPPPYARLVMLGPPNAGQEFPLEEGEIVVGRTDENAIVINHRSISRSHAKIVVTDNVCRLYDLDSANGVRVNGEDRTDIALGSGDLVEFGTVRLRFVGPREEYTFDADATVQMDAVPEDVLEQVEGRRSIVPVLVIVAVVALVGVGIAAAVVLSGGNGDDGTTLRTEPPSPPPLPAATSPLKIKEHAKALLGQKMWTAAVGVLESLGTEADDEAQKLRLQATAEQENQRHWEQACNLGDPTALQAIHVACSLIKTDSVYYENACCEGSGRRYGQKQVESARQYLEQRDYANAHSVAQAVAIDKTIPPDVRTQADTVANRAKEQLDSKVAVASITPGSHQKTRPPDNNSKSTDTDAGSTRTKGDANEALEQARQFVLSGNQQGCISVLRGAPRTPRVVNVLMSCYYEAGQVDAACRLGRSYEKVLSNRQKQILIGPCR
jgi:pSer/pThr/pTyr-binding forkhead associated (FHA) protein